jgi:hypothetical protein
VTPDNVSEETDFQWVIPFIRLNHPGSIVKVDQDILSNQTCENPLPTAKHPHSVNQNFGTENECHEQLTQTSPFSAINQHDPISTGFAKTEIPVNGTPSTILAMEVIANDHKRS